MITKRRDSQFNANRSRKDNRERQKQASLFDDLIKRFEYELFAHDFDKSDYDIFGKYQADWMRICNILNRKMRTNVIADVNDFHLYAIKND